LCFLIIWRRWEKRLFLRCPKLTSAGLKGTGGKKGYPFEFPWTKEIPENAFYGMKSLKNVLLPETIKVIGKNAFKACAALESINLPENVKCDKKAFKDCKKLSLERSNMKALPDFTIQSGYLVAYRGKDSMVEIPEGVTCIGRKALYQSNVTNIILPGTVSEIEEDAFGHSSLKSIAINGTIIKVGAGAFPSNEELNQSIFRQIPISCFSKSDQEFALRYFMEHAEALPYSTDVRKQNLAFMGKNILKPFKSGLLCDALINKGDLFF
jgi:hypothetical protein